MSETKIKVIRPTNNVVLFETNVALVSKELAGFATQTHVTIGSDGMFYYSAVIFYKVN